MEITLSLPDVLATKLQTEARVQQRSTEEVAVELLDQALENAAGAELDALIARIRALPPEPDLIRQPTASLEEYLARSLAAEAEDDEPFDQEEWQRQWDVIQAEMKAVTRANNIAEGRR